EAQAAVPGGLAEKISSAGPASLAAGAGIAGGWLVVEVLRAMRFARIKVAIGMALVVAVAFVATRFLGDESHQTATAVEAPTTRAILVCCNSIGFTMVHFF